MPDPLFAQVRRSEVQRSWTSALRSSRKFIQDTVRSPTTRKGPALANTLSELCSGYPDGVLALGMRGAERAQSLPGLIEAMGALDGNPEGAGLQHSTQAL